MRFFPQENFIMRLKGKLPGHPSLDWARKLSVEECLAELRRLSGEDFGNDTQAWQSWWRDSRKRMDIDPDF